MCLNLLRKKYLQQKSFFNCNYRGGSQFWKGLKLIGQDCKRGLKYNLGNGDKISFWLHVWKGECPLKIVFPRLLEICNQQKHTVKQVLGEGGVNLTFRRSFGLEEIEEWEHLLHKIDGTIITNEEDTVSWAFQKSDQFTTASLYHEITFPVVPNRWMMLVWEAKLPLKIKIFLASVQ